MEVIAILKGGARKVSTLLKGVCEKFYPVLKGAGAKSFRYGFPIL